MSQINRTSIPRCNLQHSYQYLLSRLPGRIKKTRKNHHRHHKPDVMERYYQRYLLEKSQNSDEPVMLRLAEEVDLSHSLFARIILERHLATTCYEGDHPPKAVVSQIMKDPFLLEDKVLAYEIQQCILNDPNYGPLVDNIKRSVGYEYEFILKEKLQNRNIEFIDEDIMRAKGYDKTPDFKLEIPIAVDGHVVNWIESKASFGDEYNHQAYLKEQFWSYWNRFGPGLVIYWFGFIDELDCNRERGILIKDEFPVDIVTLDALLD
ncbi:CDAN1-interacting nuclease 1 isoform X2 [Nematostella vectensis]|uniref:CDAN1-interacting nuclease 1 isoform X2 n=1 Tax=Nematostella vectensis TaxID=45351 RepID=UPI001390093D|nr:CDAN1-interacting nuclease 1 isoform X2 [Nematostella vectensis]